MTDAGCTAPTGAITLNTTGGVAPLTFAWTGPGGFTATTANITALASGSYHITVTDVNGCTLDQDITVGQATNTLAIAPVVTDAGCTASTGAITLNATGGVAPLTFAWTGPGGFTATTANITALASGSYHITVTDVNGCTLDQDITVGQATNTLAIAPVVTDAGCTASTGAITLNTTGGVAPLTFAWTGPGGFTATTANITALASGSYHITVTDVNGCTLDQDITVGQATNTLAIAPVVTDAGCTASTGAITLNATGGVAPLTFAWTGPGGFTATTANITALASGSYHITVTDVNGCTLDQDITVGQATNTLAIAPVVTDAGCTASTGAITLNATGGVAPLTFAWTGPGGFTATTANITALASGSYHITVTDVNGCTLDQDITVGQATNTLAIAPVVTDAGCTASTGAITLNATGGVAPLTFAWTGPGGFTATTANITALASGSYHITVTDVNGCTLDQDITVGQATNTLAIAPVVTDAGCTASTGAITLNTTGGVAPLTFAWTGPGGFTATTANITALASGSYHITVTDVNGCTLDQDITVGQATNTLAIAPVVTDAGCTASTGAITLNTTGGVAPLTFAWTGPGGFTATTANITALASGSYHITVTDVNGCTLDQDITVGQATNTLAIAPAVTDAGCTASTGAITLNTTGGVAPLTFAWTGPGGFTATTANITALASGSYHITVTDVNGCTLDQDITVGQATNTIAIAPVVTDAGCTASTGAITLNTTGGVAPLTFAWTGPGGFTSTTANITALASGSYHITVTDVNGCTLDQDITVGQATNTLAIAPVVTDAGCTASTGAITLNTTGGVAPLTFAWTGPGGFTATTANITALASGSYHITVTDVNGCTLDQDITVGQATNTLAIAPVVTDAGCTASTGAITLNTTGGVAPLTYAWTGPGGFTSTTANITALASGAIILQLLMSMDVPLTRILQLDKQTIH